MTPFTGQITRLGLQGTQAIVWPDRPFYMRAFIKVYDRSKAFLKGFVE